MAGKIWNRLITLLLVAALLLAAVLYLPRVFGIEPLIVLSGSMEPKYPVGSMVYVQHREPEMMKEGDVMTFYLSEDTVVTHRIVSVDQTNRQFITKGDANTDADLHPVPYANLIGKVVWSAPKLGEILATIATKTGKAAVAGVIGIVLVLQVLAGLLKKEKKE